MKFVKGLKFFVIKIKNKELKKRIEFNVLIKKKSFNVLGDFVEISRMEFEEVVLIRSI